MKRRSVLLSLSALSTLPWIPGISGAGSSLLVGEDMPRMEHFKATFPGVDGEIHSLLEIWRGERLLYRAVDADPIVRIEDVASDLFQKLIDGNRIRTRVALAKDKGTPVEQECMERMRQEWESARPHNRIG